MLYCQQPELENLEGAGVAPRRETIAKTALLAVAEANFGRQVLAARVPVLVLFGAQRCHASRALRPLLAELAELHAGRMRIATVDAERAPLLAEQIGVQATPTLVIVRDGEVVTRAVGFVPAALLRLLCDQIAGETLPPGPFWSPIEETFEDLVVAPLLDAWGFRYARQAACPAPARGRIDFLVYDRPAQPLTLFENKRQIMSADALARAVAQAHAYARALRLPSFVVAAPAGLWIYASANGPAQAVRRVSSLELVVQQPGSVPELLRQLGRQNGD